MTTTLLLACLGFAGVVVFFLLVRGASGRPGPTGSATRKSHDRRVTLGADGFTFTDAYLTPGTEIVYEADRANGMTRGTFMMTKSPVWVYLGNAPLAVRLLPGRLPGFVETPSAGGFGRGGGALGRLRLRRGHPVRRTSPPGASEARRARRGGAGASAPTMRAAAKTPPTKEGAVSPEAGGRPIRGGARMAAAARGICPAPTEGRCGCVR